MSSEALPTAHHHAGRKRALITGASGFIGSACLPALQKQGFEIHAVSSQQQPSAAGIVWHLLDFLDTTASAVLLEKIRPTHLLHLAWFAKPGVFWNSEENFRWLNASTELFRAFYRYGGQRVVGAGSCAEYQWVEENCNEQHTPLRPDTVYGRSKLAASLMLDAAASLTTQNAAWARIFFPYGPGEPAGRLIPSVIEALLGNRPVACTHGNQLRDFIYVDDAAEALARLLASEAVGAFNIGSGIESSLRDVVDVITGKLGHNELVNFGARPTPPGDPHRVVADIDHIIAATGWRPSVSLELGIDHTIAAWRNRLRIKGKG